MHELNSEAGGIGGGAALGPGAGAPGKILDVKVHVPLSTVNVRYGARADVERARLLRHSLKSVTRRMWVREKARLQEGGKGENK